MATQYGKVKRRVKYADLNRVGVTGSTILFNGDKDGGLELTFRADQVGCGGPTSSFAVEFKSEIAWDRIEIEFNFLANFGCWSIGSDPAIDSLISIPSGFTSLNNLLPFNSSNKDRVYAGEYTYNLPQFQVSNEVDYVYRCDGATNNWGVYNTTNYRKFKMIRTKNIKNSPAGILVVRTCTDTGASALSTLKNIYFI
jgi:hypothetical protein